MSTIEITPLELAVLKKLALVNYALGQKLEGEAGSEQCALAQVLNDIVMRAELASLAAPAGLSARQVELGRRALGLSGGRTRSFRNRFVARQGSPDFVDWSAMAAGGFAEHDARSDYHRFALTLKGAKAVLKDGETLDHEDFPEVAT